MAGYAIVWLFFGFFALVFIAMIVSYYTLRFASFLRRYWSGN